MESNNELMILSLLNLYTSYVNLKKNAGNLKRKPFQNHFAATREVCEKRHTGQNNIETAINPTSFEEKGNSPVSCSLSANRAEDIVTTLAADTKQVKCRAKRRKRGEAKKAKDIKQKKPRVRRWRVRPLNKDRLRSGYHLKVFSNVKKMDETQFFEHTRMSKTLYDWLLSFTHSSLRRSRQSILAEERFALTLNYLAYGTSLQSIAFKHKIGKSTARQIVLDTCNVLVDLLSPLYLSQPTASQYADIAEEFQQNFFIPNCVGVVDAKRLLHSNPRNKEDNTIYLVAVCDTKYKFSAMSVGKLNKQREDGLFKLVTSKCEISSNEFSLPANKPLYPASPSFPYYFISDKSFPLRKNVMRIYTETNLDTTQSIFNFKISRARLIMENAFGILTARFRVLLTNIEFLADGCKIVILACLALHNYIMTNDENQLYCPPNFVDQENESGIIECGEWRNELKRNGDQPLPSIANCDFISTNEANKFRDILADYFASEAITYDIQID